ncbi:aklavinone 12-hydroxylase RdmE [Amycolatopsis australiensis]|uniref:2-polyprenyl-6-methoxyphenol hydroxylase n=1 Tax=Amycolatopsis australiensis TaxID=546364 RepID=A0A1K1R3L2_9PSEU|nr:FAD-dependent monooxygenase [Amycolatopsis australiensis]SFW66505.1 2-polyprenyl-6-methoxyphenol hydroxylase [Amycolatopsis australiensis]
MTERVQVLVVGAGLGGLSASLFLAQAGVEVLTVERHAGTSIHPRAAGQNWRTMELFHWAGIDREVLAVSPRASQGLRITVATSLAGRVLHRLVEDGSEFDVSATTTLPAGMAGQDVVEPIMLAHAEKAGARVRFRTELVDLEQDADGVTATLRHRDTGERSVVRADYVVAADGGRSGVRQRLGIGTTGMDALSHCLGVVFDADLGDRVQPGVTDLFYLQHGDFTAGFVNTDVPNRYVFAPDYFPEKGETPADFDHDRLVAMIRAATDLPDLRPEIVWTGSWEVAARLADRFRSGRVFLVGDAAKVTPPTGGMGGNTAIGDGADIAWKLAAVLRGEAGDALLDTYEAERRPYARMVVDTSLHNMKQRMHPGLDVSGITKAEDPLGIALGFRYRSTAVLAEEPDDGERVEDVHAPTGRPGFRAPGLASTVDLLGHSWVLLCAGDGSRWEPAAASAGLRVDCHVVDDDVFASRYGLAKGGASLVRPDGVVAWRAKEPVEDPAGTLRQVLDAVLSR